MKLRILAALAFSALLGTEVSAQIKTASIRTNVQVPSQYTWLVNSKNRILSSVNISSSSQVMDSKSQLLATGGNGRVEMGVGLIPAINPEKINRTTPITSGGSEPLACVKKNISLDLVTNQDFSILKQSLNSKIFPGAFFRGNSIINQAYTFYPAPQRKPIKAIIDLPAYRTNGLREIVLDQPGTFQTLKFDSLKSTNYGISLPAFIGASSDDISSRIELAARLEVSAGLFLPLEEFEIPLDVSIGTQGSGALDVSATLNYYMFKLVQPMFTISIQSPNPADWFADPLAHKTLSDGVMVNSVTYGRMAYIIVSSFESEVKVRNAVQARLGLTFTGASEIKFGDQVDVSGSVDFNTVINSFKAVIIGGNSNAGNKVVSDVSLLKNYITDPTAVQLTDQTGALPIAYSLVRISDNSNVGIRSTASYDVIEDCTPVLGYAVYIRNFTPSKVVDNPLNGNTEDIYGQIQVQAFYTKADGTTVEVKDEFSRPASVFTRGENSVVQLREKELFHLFRDDNTITEGKRRFLFTPEQAERGYILIRYRLKDRIMQDGEQLGNSNSFVRYEEKDLKFFLSDWNNISASGCTTELKEVNGEAKVCVSFAAKKE